MRALGFTTSRTGRVLKEVCDELDVDYTHFGPRARRVDLVEEAVRSSSTWAEVTERLGFAPGSGSARATVRRQCRLNGIDVSGLMSEACSSELIPSLVPRPERLRHAGPYLVAGTLTLAGVPVSLAPEGVAYDLIGDFPREGPRRIQVKTVTSGSHCNLSRKEYNALVHGGHRRALYTAEDIDYFACVTFDRGIYLIPIEAVEGKGSASLRRYEAFRLPPSR